MTSLHRARARAHRKHKALLEQRYVRDAVLLLQEGANRAKQDLGEDHELTLGLAHTYFQALWLHHFFGHKRYREYLRTAVKGLIALIFLAVNLFGSWDHQTCEEIQDTLRRVLAHQLDWSLDDLELDSTERQMVDVLLEDPDDAKF